MGLDIGSSSVKAIELRPVRAGFRISAIGVEPFPRQARVDAGDADRAIVSSALNRLLARKDLRANDVALSLSGHAVIVKKITLPAMTPAELAQSIVWEAEQYIPFPIHDVNLDYQILDAGDGEGTMEVLLVAAKKETIASYATLVSDVGRRPAVVDVDAFALQNAYEANYGFEPNAVVALVNIGAGATNVNVVAGSHTVFTRDISMGGHAFTEALQRELEIDYDAAELVKRGVAVHAASYDDARPVLQAVTESLIVELRKTFDFYKSTAASARLDRLMVSGGGSRVEGLVEALQERFHVAVERFDPFRRIRFDAARLEGADAEALAPIAAVAVGLALRRAGDR